ncbi:MAG: ATP phosphoribosyltransferase regulatory subunit, partial [Actinomycetia bacterium]|nr:ATP phosphoribosyltransferase regulatory subunit [Actinomycetes bacterium]
MDLKIPKGTKDIFGEDAEKKILIECIVTEIMRSYNFKPSFTPVFEFTELFVRGIGKSTDIVKKEMYTFQDRGGRQLTLRPEGTAPIARLYIMNNLDKLSKPVKLYYFLPMYRYERPQAGRSREFWQIGAEIIGSDSYLTDVEAIVLM